MEVHLDSQDTPMGQDESAGKRRRTNGWTAPSPADVADHTGRLLAEREHDWLEQLTNNPASLGYRPDSCKIIL